MTRQLAAAETAAQQRQYDYEGLVKGLMTPQDGIHKELKTAKENELKWKTQCQQLVTKLDLEFVSSEGLSRKWNQERLRNKELESELSDLRLVLHQSQSALVLQQAQPIPLFTRTDARFPSTTDTLQDRYAKISTKSKKEKVGLI